MATTAVPAKIEAARACGAEVVLVEGNLIAAVCGKRSLAVAKLML
jgi:threonine dehydratase